MTQKITANLWFDNQAEEAVDFYISLFDDAEVLNVLRYVEGGMGEVGKVMTITFRLAGQVFTAINGGPEFQFTEAVSFAIDCGSQEEVDRYWELLTAEGEPGPCGWLKDKYGLSWQVVPRRLLELLHDPDQRKVSRVTQAMLQMGKLDIAALEAAYDAA
ncbi:MAG: hypothetical protein DCC58_16215 [Chloroflexi bacterium]|nr:MAG: hypothetical protein DCC58_16215 [Chloroflexota bacterium]